MIEVRARLVAFRSDNDIRAAFLLAEVNGRVSHHHQVVVGISRSHAAAIIPYRGVTHASERESKAVAGLLEGLSLPPVSLDGDTGYNDSRLRHLL